MLCEDTTPNMQINPKEVLERGIVVPCEFTECQQVGIDLSLKEDVKIEHGSSFNVLLNETINLPIDVFATFHQRSSYSRKGVFVTTGIYDPGYSGSLGCTIYNLSGTVVEIPKDTRIGQLLCFKAEAASAYQGQWQGK